MPNSILMYPDAGTLVGEDLFYLVKGAGGADRDRHVTLEAIRRFCTSQGVEFKEVSLALASAPAITDVDITSTSNVVLVVWGRFPNPTDNRLNVHGTIPEGCTVTIISGHLGIIDLRVNGTAPANAPADLDFGTFGHAVLTSRDGQFLTSVFNDARWNKATRDAAIQAETERAQTAEGNLASMIQGEASQRQEDITQTQALISAEVDRATAAETDLRTYQAHVVPQTVTLWTNTDIYSQDAGVITVRGPRTSSTSGVGVDSTVQTVIGGDDSELCPAAVTCWRPATVFDGPTLGAGNVMLSKFQRSLAGSQAIAVTGGSPTNRVAMLSWNRALGKIVVEALPGTTVADPAATVGLLLPVPNPERFEELLVRVVVAEDVSCEMIVMHPTNDHGLEIPRTTINDGRNWWIRARHAVGADWRMDCWWEPKRV